MENDNVNNPIHYTQGKWEVHEIINGMLMTDWREANVLKYAFRYKYKRELEDLKKCKWYLEKLISDIENGNTKIVDYKLVNDFSKDIDINSKELNQSSWNYNTDDFENLFGCDEACDILEDKLCCFYCSLNKDCSGTCASYDDKNYECEKKIKADKENIDNPIIISKLWDGCVADCLYCDFTEKCIDFLGHRKKEE